MREQMALTKEELSNISGELILTDHAIDRTLERGGDYNLDNIHRKVKNSVLGWYSGNGYYKIKVGAKLLAIIEEVSNGYVVISVYNCYNCKSHGRKAPSKRTIEQHFDKDNKTFKKKRTQWVINNLK